MGLPVRHAGWLSFAWRDNICLRVIEALTLLQKQNKQKRKGETEGKDFVCEKC